MDSFYHDSLKYEHLHGEKLEKLEKHFASVKELLDKGIGQDDLRFLENDVTGTYWVPGKWGKQKYMKYILTDPRISEELRNYLIEIQTKYPLQNNKKRPRDDGSRHESLPKQWELHDQIRNLELTVSFWKRSLNKYNVEIEEYVKMNVDNVNHKNPIEEIKRCFHGRRIAESEISDLQEKIALLRHQAYFGY